MPVKCLNCYELLADSEELTYHVKDCQPYVGAVWLGPSQLAEGVYL